MPASALRDSPPADRQRPPHRRSPGRSHVVRTDVDVLPDQELVQRAQLGCTDAFSELVRRHSTQVHRVAWGVLGDEGHAEDVAQIVFLQAWIALPRFRSECSFSTWLHTIGIRAALRHGRSNQPLAEQHVDLAGDSTDEPYACAEMRLRAAAVRSAVAELPLSLRIPLTLVQFEDFSYDQVAHLLGTSVSTVRGRVARGRSALRPALQAWR